MNKSPTEGGCWYCHKDDDQMVFSCEFDCFLHIECLKQQLKTNPQDPEVQIFAREFQIRS